MTRRPLAESRVPRPSQDPDRPGSAGINAIERIVLEMGSRWTPSGPNEIGIDGYIELSDPNSRQALGLTLAVQSKVVTAVAGSADKHLITGVKRMTWSTG